MVRWTHEDLASLAIDEVAAEAGVPVTAVDAGIGGLKEPAAAAAVGVSAADWALAETGTLVLLTAPDHERTLSLLPPVHVAVLRAERILKSVDDLPAILATDGPSVFRGLTLVSGPSSTGDIEMVPVYGVHGPGRMIVILWETKD